MLFTFLFAAEICPLMSLAEDQKDLEQARVLEKTVMDLFSEEDRIPTSNIPCLYRDGYWSVAPSTADESEKVFHDYQGTWRSQKNQFSWPSIPERKEREKKGRGEFCFVGKKTHANLEKPIQNQEWYAQDSAIVCVGGVPPIAPSAENPPTVDWPLDPAIQCAFNDPAIVSMS